MDPGSDSRPTQDKTFKGSVWTILIVSVFLHVTHCHSSNPHQPQVYNWELTRTETGVPISIVNTSGQPIFNVDLCAILGQPGKAYYKAMGRLWSSPYGCGDLTMEKGLQGTQLYMCPQEGSPTCAKPNEYYCASWGCETIAPWESELGGRDHYISLSRPTQSVCTDLGSCNPVILTVKQWNAQTWTTGKTWGLRLYVSGVDPGILITVQRQVTRRFSPLPIGPNHLLNPLIPLPPPSPPLPLNSLESATPTIPTIQSIPRAPQLSNPMLGMLDAVFGFVNQTNPNITSDCWFCLNPAPPYYVGLGATAAFGNSTHQIRNISESDSRTLCPWGRTPKLTLGDLQGQGTCIYSTGYPLSTSPYAQNCNSTTLIDTTPLFYLVAPQGTWFACNTGLTPCISSNYWSQGTNGFCVLVHVIPQVYFYSGEGGRKHFQHRDHHIAKRAPILIPTLVGRGIAGSTAVGTAALVTGDSNYWTLSQQVAKDLQDLETLVSHRETSVNSLAEAVLQNRRELNLQFLKQGGLCKALGETCCFYANHSGIIRANLALLRQRIRDREEQRQRTGSWYKNLFNGSPRLTTLLTSITGPLILVFLGLLFGPCIIN